MKFLILVALFGLSLAQHNPHLKSGRTAIVHLFEWRWADIAAECERYLGPNGFGGVQVCLLELMSVNDAFNDIAGQKIDTIKNIGNCFSGWLCLTVIAGNLLTKISLSLIPFKVI